MVLGNASQKLIFLAGLDLVGFCQMENKEYWPGMVAHTFISALWKAKVGGSPEVGSLRPA